MIDALAEPLHLPDDPELLVRANGAAMVAAGSMLGAGRLPRLSAAGPRRLPGADDLRGAPVLAGARPGQARRAEPDFLKNLGLLGGLLLAAVDTGGKPGLAWRARRAAKDARRTAAPASARPSSVARSRRRSARREARLVAAHAHDALT